MLQGLILRPLNSGVRHQFGYVYSACFDFEGYPTRVSCLCALGASCHSVRLPRGGEWRDTAGGVHQPSGPERCAIMSVVDRLVRASDAPGGGLCDQAASKLALLETVG